jgi:hypothetical protein
VLLLVLAEGTHDAGVQKVGMHLIFTGGGRGTRRSESNFFIPIFVRTLFAKVDKIFNVPEFFIINVNVYLEIQIVLVKRGRATTYKVPIFVKLPRVESFWGASVGVAKIAEVRPERSVHGTEH